MTPGMVARMIGMLQRGYAVQFKANDRDEIVCHLFHGDREPITAAHRHLWEAFQMAKQQALAREDAEKQI